jgi:hypothetical protein
VRSIVAKLLDTERMIDSALAALDRKRRCLPTSAAQRRALSCMSRATPREVRVVAPGQVKAVSFEFGFTLGNELAKDKEV